MRQWALYRKNQIKLSKGEVLISFIYENEGRICREDRRESEMKVPDELPQGCLGWWRSVARAKPPTQKELCERLERLLEGLPAATSTHKEVLLWLICLYLTRKRILRQNGAAFTHVKTGVVYQTQPDAIEPTLIEAAMTELMEVIS